jgi:hypothetical protein
MTLFEWLFQEPAAHQRQTTAPLYNERLAYLTHMKEHDRKYNTLRAMATHLLHIIRTLGFSNEMRVLTMEELRGAGRAWAQYTGPLRKKVPRKWSYELYMRISELHRSCRFELRCGFGLEERCTVASNRSHGSIYSAEVFSRRSICLPLPNP